MKKINEIELVNLYDGNPCCYIVGCQPKHAGLNREKYDIVKSIEEHITHVEGDKWFYTVIFENGNEILLFNVINVYKEVTNEKGD